ncbi:hypothetical protein BU26DRAFT_522648 [Trematosphaeria pertusa]|uniref:Protein kinase domain-containing protein n=1 Tax=Trematosphaeria pertusa TaxID=390896 RepID=A0A6A6I3U3_9PLEO|nr:uncharacterized protein BU26DRAFT_522648 [Trematosphaeria pertusa]KAF2244937.1 hypothetical protein BU26DRAFT_522648 [Trematosphaeria pertusa]
MIDSTSLSSKPGVTPDSARYTHPKYWGHVDARFEALYDIYSLGIVLIEIALWKTTKTMAEKLNRDPTRTEISLAEWRDAVEKDLIPEVERRAGRIYGDVVRRCVTGDFGDAACRSDVGRLLKAFDREVVAKLEKCYA